MLVVGKTPNGKSQIKPQSSMSNINTISPDNIGQLNERQFVGLLRVLLYSEARQ
jgi:hypothetical protein